MSKEDDDPWTFELLKAVEARPELWDKKDERYRLLTARKESWKSVADEVFDGTGTRKTWEQCRKRWESVRDEYIRQKKKIPPTGTAASNVIKYKFASGMRFLDDDGAHRSSFSNIPPLQTATRAPLPMSGEMDDLNSSLLDEPGTRTNADGIGQTVDRHDVVDSVDNSEEAGPSKPKSCRRNSSDVELDLLERLVAAAEKDGETHLADSRYKKYGNMVARILEDLPKEKKRKALADLLRWTTKYEIIGDESDDMSEYE